MYAVARLCAGINIRETGGVPIYNGDIIDDYLRFRVDNRKFCWQKGAGRFETLPGIPRSLSLLVSLPPRRDPLVSLPGPRAPPWTPVFLPVSKLSLFLRAATPLSGRQAGCDSKVRDDFDSGTASNLSSIPASIGPVWAHGILR